jgi:hypothetical protein
LYYPSNQELYSQIDTVAANLIVLRNGNLGEI